MMHTTDEIDGRLARMWAEVPEWRFALDYRVPAPDVAARLGAPPPTSECSVRSLFARYRTRQLARTKAADALLARG